MALDRAGMTPRVRRWHDSEKWKVPMTFRIKRVYEAPEPSDGARFLVERLWPRGIKKAALPLTAWLKEVAPSTALRREFGHHPAQWDDFCRRYVAELDTKPQAWQPLLDAQRQGPVTLLYSARDRAHNSAVALQAYLENQRRAGAS